ncbi:AMP-binding protein [Actinomycetospora chibensis]|uniref:acetate--CoA ligase n=1 Tax=Actinomycetospora chibensis TaxID=663606 RepID=A0ABV9RMQ4_9PSEU|nr:AMP-binding protein [Actinomycetospora chibensis]MDD7923066.1 AMP-binding protein [Actinomycetospora chibensis]
MDDRDTLATLISAPLQPLDERWRSADRVDELATARARHDTDPDDYWVWVAEKHRWLEPWHTVRSGELGDFRYFEGGRINVADNCVDRWAEDPATADRAAIVWEGEPGDTRTVTYAELADEVNRLAGGLVALGIGRGDVVAVYMPNLVEAFTAIHACNRIGAIYTVLFSGFGRDAVASRLAAARAKAVVVADAIYRRGKPVELLETLRAARSDAPTVEHVVVVDRTGRSVPLEGDEVSYAALLAEHPEGAPMASLDPNEAAFLIFTSGTESKPKGVVHSVGGFLLGTWANVHWQAGPVEGDVYWVAADVGWLTFPIQAVIGGLAHGSTIACYEGALDTPSPSRFYDVCERHGVTQVLCAPTVLRMLRKFGDDLAASHPLPRLALITVQGEPLDGETFTWATETFGVPIVNAYGQTETGSTWTYPVTGVDDLKAGSAGTPVPGHAFDVVDDDGAPVVPGVKGNLVMTRPFPTLARTVWDDHDRYLSTYFGRFPGRYATNDEAVVDTDGHLWVLGRADDVINVAAHRLSTMEIEAVVGTHPRVVEAAVVGVPDATKGTVPVAFVTVSGETEGVPDEVRDLVGETIGGLARPDRVIVTSAMPKTRTGKIMRRLMREVLLHGEARSDTSALEDPGSLDTLAAAVRA